MEKIIFKKVWYLPSENKWRDLNLLAFKDVGRLIVVDNSVVFEGKKGKVLVTNIKRVTYGKQGRDFINNWIKVEYGEGDLLSTAFFADGSSLGWGGIFGGTKKILKSLQKISE